MRQSAYHCGWEATLYVSLIDATFSFILVFLFLPSPVLCMIGIIRDVMLVYSFWCERRADKFRLPP